VRRIVWALIVAVLLSAAPAPVLAASPAYACSKHRKKVKYYKPGKYKVKKFKGFKKKHWYSSSKPHR
jgi:hypothetical protein